MTPDTARPTRPTTGERQQAPRAGRTARGAVVALLTCAAGIALLAAGVHWHAPLAAAFGRGDGAAASSAGASESKSKQLWTCGMHPQVIQDHPGDCPICHMKLTPLQQQNDAGNAASSGGLSVRIDPVVVQNMGVRVAPVTRGPLARTIRAVGYLEEAEPLVRDVNLRVSGWIEKLHAATLGQRVEADAPLFELYSPEVQIAVQELIA
ncbi:MAG TPA: efflux RND transporter periplasmic adaptor subunit, partial [Tepidisphaeraceae bacterium]